MRLIGGSAMPCVCAAPRATFAQKLSTSFGVTRTSSTGGKSATYSDQLPNSSTGRVMRRTRSTIHAAALVAIARAHQLRHVLRAVNHHRRDECDVEVGRGDLVRVQAAGAALCGVLERFLGKRPRRLDRQTRARPAPRPFSSSFRGRHDFTDLVEADNSRAAAPPAVVSRPRTSSRPRRRPA